MQGGWESPSEADRPCFSGECLWEEVTPVQSEWPQPQGRGCGTEMETSVCRPGREAKTQIHAKPEEFHSIISQHAFADPY